MDRNVILGSTSLVEERACFRAIVVVLIHYRLGQLVATDANASITGSFDERHAARAIDGDKPARATVQVIASNVGACEEFACVARVDEQVERRTPVGAVCERKGECDTGLSITTVTRSSSGLEFGAAYQ